MTTTPIDEDRMNLEIRKFLKIVGITSQREIEKALRSAAAAGTLADLSKLEATVTLEVPSLELRHVIQHSLAVK